MALSIVVPRDCLIVYSAGQRPHDLITISHSGLTPTQEKVLCPCQPILSQSRLDQQTIVSAVRSGNEHWFYFVCVEIIQTHENESTKPAGPSNSPSYTKYILDILRQTDTGSKHRLRVATCGLQYVELIVRGSLAVVQRQCEDMHASGPGWTSEKAIGE